MTVIERRLAKKIATAIDAEHGATFVGCHQAEGTKAVARTVAKALAADHKGAVDPEITDAELDAGWGAWHVAWVTTDGRTAMRSALAAFLAARGGR